MHKLLAQGKLWPLNRKGRHVFLLLFFFPSFYVKLERGDTQKEKNKEAAAWLSQEAEASVRSEVGCGDLRNDSVVILA